jgi:hypothetical protein
MKSDLSHYPTSFLGDLGALYVPSAFHFQQPAARVFREWVIKLEKRDQAD